MLPVSCGRIIFNGVIDRGRAARDLKDWILVFSDRFERCFELNYLR